MFKMFLTLQIWGWVCSNCSMKNNWFSICLAFFFIRVRVTISKYLFCWNWNWNVVYFFSQYSSFQLVFIFKMCWVLVFSQYENLWPVLTPSHYTIIATVGLLYLFIFYHALGFLYIFLSFPCPLLSFLTCLWSAYLLTFQIYLLV